MKLKYFSYIDPIYIYKAETFISHTTKTLNQFLDYENHKELVVFKPNILNKYVKTQYEAMTKLYGGCVNELIRHKDEEIRELKYKSKMEKEIHVMEIDKYKINWRLRTKN